MDKLLWIVASIMVGIAVAAILFTLAQNQFDGVVNFISMSV